ALVSPEERAGLTFERALWLGRAGMESEAEQVLAELDGERPDYLPLHFAIERRHLGRGEAQALAHLYEAEAERAQGGGFGLPPDREWAAAAALVAGALWEGRLGDPDRAASLYRAALGYAPGDREATFALDRLLAGAGRHAERANLLEADRAHA